MENHIPIRPDISLLLGRQTSKWSLWDVAFHENNSMSVFELNFSSLCMEVSDKFRKCKSEERTMKEDVDEEYRELFHPHENKPYNVQVNHVDSNT